MTYITLHVEKWLYGSTPMEMEFDEIACFTYILARAALTGADPPGLIYFFSEQHLANQLHVPLDLLKRTLEKCREFKKIKFFCSEERINIRYIIRRRAMLFEKWKKHVKFKWRKWKYILRRRVMESDLSRKTCQAKDCKNISIRRVGKRWKDSKGWWEKTIHFCQVHFDKYDQGSSFELDKIKDKKTRCCECKKQATYEHHDVYFSYDGWGSFYTCDEHFSKHYDEEAEKEFDRFINADEKELERLREGTKELRLQINESIMKLMRGEIQPLNGAEELQIKLETPKSKIN